MGSDTADSILPHQTAHPAVPDTQAQLVQLFGHPGAAIAAQTGPVLIADMRQPSGIHSDQWRSCPRHVTPLPVRDRPMFPGPKAAIRDPDYPAGLRLGKLAAIVVQKRELHGFWAAKT